MTAPAKRRGLVIGAGGVVGYTWIVCALERLARTTGWDPRSADVMIGTSAGSIISTLLAAGVTPAELLAWQKRQVAPRRERSSTAVRAPQDREHLPPRPRLKPLSLSLVGAGLRARSPVRALVGLAPEGTATEFGLARAIDKVVTPGDWVDHPRVWLVAMDADSGERVAFGRAGSPSTGAREAVRASCAVPGWFAPVRIAGRRFVDGGVISPTSLDLLEREPVDEVVVISPLTSRHPAPSTSLAEGLERLLRRTMTRTLDREVELLERAGKRVIRIEPTHAELAAMGPNFMDPRRRRLVLDAWAS